MSNSDALRSTDHHRISPTAHLAAYFRSFSDIPYAQEISAAFGSERVSRQVHGDELDSVTRWAGPYLEARYKCFNRFINGHRNVMELAVGASVERGLSISDDPGKVYIGADLPEMIDQTKALLNRIDGGTRTNHYLEAANVLSADKLNAGIGRLGERREVLIINEGLLEYLTTDEKALCADNVRKIIECYGGKWVTPDIYDVESINLEDSLFEPEVRSAISRSAERLSNFSGRDVTNNSKNFFASKQQAVKFLRELRFEVNQYPMVEDISRVASIAKLWGDREKRLYEPGLTKHIVWVMSLH